MRSIISVYTREPDAVKWSNKLSHKQPPHLFLDVCPSDMNTEKQKHLDNIYLLLFQNKSH